MTVDIAQRAMVGSVGRPTAGEEVVTTELALKLGDREVRAVRHARTAPRPACADVVSFEAGGRIFTLTLRYAVDGEGRPTPEAQQMERLLAEGFEIE